MKRAPRRHTVRPNAGREVGDELRFHIDMRTEEFIEAGMTPDEARRAAVDAFGDVDAIDRALRRERARLDASRERRERLAELRADVRFALRSLRSRLGFTVATLATLALGIGATTSVVTVVDGVLLRPLPYADASRLAMVWLSSKQPGLGSELPVSAGIYTHTIAPARAFSSTAALRAWSYSLNASGGARQLSAARVTPSLFPTLGVRPVLGRQFSADDAAPGAPHVAAIGYSLWQREFGGREDIIGRRVELSGESFTIAAVMPPGFAFPRGAELPAGLQFPVRTEIWTPLGFSERDQRDFGTLNLAAVGRLESGTSADAARGAIDAGLAVLLRSVAPTSDLAFRIIDLRTQAGASVRTGLWLLLGAVGLVLVIACANVTNLLIARTSSRRREFAVRAALGAGRARIARQLITENALLAASGTVLGLVVSLVATRAMLRLVPGSLPRADDVSLDWRIGAIATAIAVGIGAVFALVAAMQTRFGALAGALRDESGTTAGNRAASAGRRALVAGEISLSLMLLVCASLLVASFARLLDVAPGFDPRGVQTAGLVLPIPGAFNPERDGPGWARAFAQLDARIAAGPGVLAAGGVSSLPLSGGVESGGIALADDPPPAAARAPQAQYAVVQGEYFRAMRIPLITGREFNSHDDAASAPVVIVNQEFVRRYLHGRSPIGRGIACYFDFSGGKRERTIVGVVGDVRQTTLDAAPEPQAYLPEAQMPYPALHFVVRAAGGPAAIPRFLIRELAAFDSRLAFNDVRTLADVVGESVARQRFSMVIVGVFAASAIVLAMVGLYGVIALSVGQRRREIGVRVALGARSRDVLALILADGARIGAVGIVLGAAGALAMAHLARSLLFGVAPTDARIYLLSAVIIAAVSLGATIIPARRATRLDPTAALRAE